MNDDHSVNSVRVTNTEIYKLLLDTNARVSSVEQTMREIVQPGLERSMTRVEFLSVTKADAAVVEKATNRLEKVEMRMYAIVSGLVAAFIGGKGAGIF